MKYSQDIVNKASEELNKRRIKAENDAQIRKLEFTKNYPQIIEIEAEMAKIGTQAVKSVINCSDPKTFVERLKQKSIECQNAREAVYLDAGVTKEYFEPQYTCKICKDTGYSDGKVCKCYEELLNSLSYKELADKAPLRISSFDDFNISLYKDEKARGRMENILTYCRNYANDFDLDSPNVFMFGETGLGKTHLSLAIAGTVIKKGYGVVYGSAQNLLNMVEREHFGRSEEPDGATEEKLLSCDLLILDDLGSEFTTQFIVAELYNIINTRMAKGLPTIINSNIALSELEGRYTNRITSRIIGDYMLLNFVGNDIRQVFDK